MLEEEEWRQLLKGDATQVIEYYKIKYNQEEDINQVTNPIMKGVSLKHYGKHLGIFLFISMLFVPNIGRKKTKIEEL